MKKHTDALSNTTLKRIRGGKYTPKDVSFPAIKKQPNKEIAKYEIRRTGWRRIK